VVVIGQKDKSGPEEKWKKCFLMSSFLLLTFLGLIFALKVLLISVQNI
jgi:hypothetical protein